MLRLANEPIPYIQGAWQELSVNLTESLTKYLTVIVILQTVLCSCICVIHQQPSLVKD